MSKNENKDPIKKKNGISLKDKKSIIDDINANISYDVIQHKYNLKNKSNISEIWKHREKYLAAHNDPYASPLNKSLKTTKLKQIDNGLTNFITNCNQQGVMVNDKLLREKALEIAKVANIVNFKVRNGYIEIFKARKSIHFENIHGEANSVDQNVIEQWYTMKLKDHLHLIDPENIYNGDELGLFWRMQTKSSYVV